MSAARTARSEHVGPEEAGGNVYDKYSTTNPIEKRLVERFIRTLEWMVDETEATEAHEVGCGEGELLQWIAHKGLTVRGTDAFPDVIEEARSRSMDLGLKVELEARAIQELTSDDDASELIVCCEVLEHLEDPEGALQKLAELARPWLIASVPREPLWRALNLARLTYVSDLGNTPGHLNHWSKREFLAFLETRFEVAEIRTPLPWTMALCRVR